MYWIFAIVIALLSTSCRHKERTEETPLPANSEATLALRLKMESYERLARPLVDQESGFLYAEDCDSLLFNGLYYASVIDTHTGAFDLAKAQSPSGRWERRPVAKGPCYPDESKSTISKDMILGVMYFAWKTRRLDIAESLASYGEAHNWIMGEPDSQLDRVVMTPSQIGLLYQVIYRLGGADTAARHLPDVYPEGKTGFEAHLEVISILLHAEVDDQEGVTDVMLGRLREQASRQPDNPLFLAALRRFDGDRTEALKALMESPHWPSDALPTSAQHCARWLVEKDDGDDWKPCPDKNETYLGGDFMFAASLVVK